VRSRKRTIRPKLDSAPLKEIGFVSPVRHAFFAVSQKSKRPAAMARRIVSIKILVIGEIDFRQQHQYRLGAFPSRTRAFVCRAATEHAGFMVKITYIDSFGEARTIEAQEGATVMENAIRNAIPEITAECGGGCACATCHVYVGEKWVGLTGKASDQEEDMLDFAYKVQPNSRLSCQIKVTPDLDGLVVTTPDRQG
jgi:ferredoxin, 2Fe-2S